ncbi:MAG: ribosome maturation factor RimM [Bacillota bacterium]
MAENLITIGQITKHQGNKGEVRVMPLTDYPERFELLDQVFLCKDDHKKQVNIEAMRYHKQFIVLKFVEFEDIGTAIEHKDYFLQIPQSESLDLPEDHYYLNDILDLEVFTTQGRRLGVVTDILETGSNDVYVVESKNQEHLIPGTKEVIVEVDLAAEKMIINPLPGLLSGEQ